MGISHGDNTSSVGVTKRMTALHQRGGHSIRLDPTTHDGPAVGVPDAEGDISREHCEKFL
jgi:hypothetical protein